MTTPLSLWEREQQRREVIRFLNDLSLLSSETYEETKKRKQLYDEIYMINQEIKEHEHQIIKKREKIKELNFELERHKEVIQSR